MTTRQRARRPAQVAGSNVGGKRQPLVGNRHIGSTRAWTRRYRVNRDKIPSMLSAGAYSSTLHYLKAVQAAGTSEPSVRMVDGRVAAVDYTGDNDDMIGREGICAPIFRGCLRAQERARQAAASDR